MSKNTVAIMLVQVFSAIVSFLALIFIARVLPLAELGDMSAAASVANIAYIICLVGADVTAMNVIALAIKNNDQGKIKAFFVYTFITVLVLSTIYIVIAVVAYFLSKNFFAFQHLHPVYIAILFVPFMALTFFFYKVLIAMYKPVISNVIFRFLLNVSTVIFILIMFIDERFQTSHVAVVFIMLPWALMGIFLFYLIVKESKFLKSQRSKIELGSWTISGVATLPYNLSIMTIPSLSVICAEIVLKNEGVVGVFAAVVFFSQLISSGVLTYIQSISTNNAISAVHSGSMAKLRKVMYANFKSMFIIGIIVIVVLIFFGRNLLSLYGDEYASASTILVFFMISNILLWMGTLTAPVLSYLNKNLFVMISSSLLMILSISLSLIFGYLYQIYGIIFGMTLAIAIVFVIQNVYLYRVIK